MQAIQKGVVGLNIYSLWAYPLSNATLDLEATKRLVDFTVGWYVVLTLLFASGMQN
jgi:beta-glucosidase